MTVGFVGAGPVVEEIDAVCWRVREPIVYQGRQQRFVIPAGFLTDFASVPRVLVWLIPRYGAYTRAAILHDYLCQSGVVSLRDADGLFRRVLREAGVSLPQRWMMWTGVRAASRLAGAPPLDVARFLLVLALSVLFLAVPVAVVQLWLLLFWLVESAFWLGARIATDVCGPPPKPKTTITE
ncbi:DUF1353 domain-containing protein [Nocardia sp. CDC159]|uniref:DUF1353 domain-containing protein n=1 Tax=Nocardia pulmonis TaxID=2951408 RepID=A0A9X2E3K2_9NOCA|nr:MULTISPECIES: DUF1353 domain-containing protein [Nocardia]MCM6773254.1 DUF1353 domain-containing protein [Nocardia pulmonis]MCM6786141.1 DUF1353 domain-containing protein [Nocardia sp. CDC159]